MNERDKIKEDHISGNFDQAFRRVTILLDSELPEDWEKEIMPSVSMDVKRLNVLYEKYNATTNPVFRLRLKRRIRELIS